jgi:hypothetical protein
MNKPKSSVMASDVTVSSFVTYLRRRRWTRVTHPNERLLVFSGGRTDSGKAVELVLPANDSFDDAKRLLSSALSTLAVVERLSVSDLANAMKFLGTDRLHKRLIISDDRDVSVPLNMAHEVVSSLRMLFSQAATQEEERRPFVSGVTTAGTDFVEQCRFGHTFRGSFGFVVESPLPAALQLDAFVDSPEVSRPDPPLPRRIIERIALGLKNLNEVEKTKDLAYLVERYETGLNANICETLATLVERVHEVEIEYSFAWSTEWPRDEALVDTGPFRLSRTAAVHLRQAAEMLRGKKQEPVEEEIVGRIIQLRSLAIPELDENEPDLFNKDRTVVIQRKLDTQRPQSVHLSLGPDDYKQACDFHKEGKTVTVLGKLVRPGRLWILQDARKFGVKA